MPFIDAYTDVYGDVYGADISTFFPQQTLGVLVELLLNGVWTDITDFVYQRDSSVDITITYGRPDESSRFQFCTATLQLNNQNGTFSSKNTASPYYPYLTRNTQVRISVQTTPLGSFGFGYIFWGEVSSWPPAWDNTGTDVWVTITASGISRRLGQNAAIGSSYSRYFQNKSTTDVTYPVAYWPCEDAVGSSQFAEVTGQGSAMTWTGTPTLSSTSSFPGSDPIPVVNSSSWVGLTGSYAPAGDLLYTTPGTYTWTPPDATVTAANVICVAGGGAGGGSSTNGSFLNGGGGGGAEYAQESALVVSSANTYTIIVGAGGQGVQGTHGKAGGDSQFKNGASILVKAQGGGFGDTSSAGTGGNYATASTHFKGGNGYFLGGTGPAGGGGSAGGQGNVGINASSATGASATSDAYSGPGGDSGGTYSGGGVTPPPTQNYVKTYTCTHSYSYQGSDAGNGLIATDTNPQQGGDVADTFNGKSKSWLLFNHAQIASDLAGATISKVTLTLYNLHSWFNSGMTIAFGWDTRTTFPASLADPTGANIDIIEGNIAEGSVHTYSIGVAFGTAFKSSGATTIVLFKNSNSLTYYGYFAGPKQSNPPKLTIYYSK